MQVQGGMTTSHSPSFLRSFRLSAREELVPFVRELLEAEGFRFEPEPFSPLCFRLLEEPFPLGSSLAAFFGYIYIQDRSSMLPPLALNPARGATVVDVCASPGSKTGLLAQLVGEEGFVLANEISHARLNTLRMTLKACNCIQVGTCSYSGDALPLRPGSCQAILLDPPCSGWGTVEKNPRVLDVWHEGKVQPLITLQRRLLARAASLLVDDGVLVYSTCTTNSDENELQVRYAEEELGLVRDPIEPFAGFVWDDRAGSEGTLRVDGTRSKAQGFYIARLRKKAQAAPSSSAAMGTDLEQGQAQKAVQKGTGGCDVSRAQLATATVQPDLLPDGRCAVFSGTVRFLPRASETFLPDGFVWQGASLGRLGTGGFQADARLRVCMQPSSQAIVLQEPGEVRSLLSGASMRTALRGKEAGLWWRDLPLGRVSLRNGRVIAGFGK